MTGPISAVVIIIAVFMVVIAFKKKLSPYETERTDFIEEELKQVIDIHAHSFKGNIIGKVITTIFIRLQLQKNLFECLKYLIKKIFDKRFSFLFFLSLFVSLLSITATL